MLSKLEAHARKALAHPDLRDVLACMSPAERDNPAALRSWLTIASEVDPSREPAIDAALSALQPVEAARGLRDKVAALYHNGKLRAEVTAAGLDFERLADNPEEAYALLVSRNAGGRLSEEFDTALTVLAEVREFARESGQALPAAAATPLPANAAGQDAEIKALIGKATLTVAEDARLTSLYEQRVAREDRQTAAAEAAGDRKPAPSEYSRLLEKDATGGLTAGESARLTQLAGDRAVADGRISREDLEAEQEYSE